MNSYCIVLLSAIKFKCLLFAHVVIMLYAHVVSSYYCKLGLYTRSSVSQLIHMVVSLCQLDHILVTRITAVHGSLATLTLPWKIGLEYIERLQFYFDSTGISGTVKQPVVLLRCCGPSTF